MKMSSRSHAIWQTGMYYPTPTSMLNINDFPLVVFGKWTLAENFNINVCTHLSHFRDFSQVIYNISSLEIYKTKEYLPRAKLCDCP
jgi:hypothetical protein